MTEGAVQKVIVLRFQLDLSVGVIALCKVSHPPLEVEQLWLAY